MSYMHFDFRPMLTATNCEPQPQMANTEPCNHRFMRVVAEDGCVRAVCDRCGGVVPDFAVSFAASEAASARNSHANAQGLVGWGLRLSNALRGLNRVWQALATRYLFPRT